MMLLGPQINYMTDKSHVIVLFSLMINYDLVLRGGENNCWTSLPVIKMKFNLLYKTSSFLIVLKFRKTYIQIFKIV